MSEVLVIDNGSFSLKCGISGIADKPFSFLNLSAVTKRVIAGKRTTFFGNAIANYPLSLLNLKSSFEKGFVVDWKIQRDIFDYSFYSVLKLSTEDLTSLPLLMSVPPQQFPILTANTLETLFEEYSFPSVCLAPSSFLSLWGASDILSDTNLLGKYVADHLSSTSSKLSSPSSTSTPLSTSLTAFFQNLPPCCIIVDIGHSVTTITPLVNSLPLSAPTTTFSSNIPNSLSSLLPSSSSSTTSSSSSSSSSSCSNVPSLSLSSSNAFAPVVTRLPLAGKQVTNILKESVSYRFFDVSEEFLLMNDVKEKMLYVTHEHSTAQAEMAAEGAWARDREKKRATRMKWLERRLEAVDREEEREKHKGDGEEEEEEEKKRGKCKEKGRFGERSGKERISRGVGVGMDGRAGGGGDDEEEEDDDDEDDLDFVVPDGEDEDGDGDEEGDGEGRKKKKKS